jgi:hypothetical protein
LTGFQQFALGEGVRRRFLVGLPFLEGWADLGRYGAALQALGFEGGVLVPRPVAWAGMGRAVGPWVLGGVLVPGSLAWAGMGRAFGPFCLVGLGWCGVRRWAWFLGRFEGVRR